MTKVNKNWAKIFMQSHYNLYSKLIKFKYKKWILGPTNDYIVSLFAFQSKINDCHFSLNFWSFSFISFWYHIISGYSFTWSVFKWIFKVGRSCERCFCHCANYGHFSQKSSKTLSYIYNSIIIKFMRKHRRFF